MTSDDSKVMSERERCGIMVSHHLLFGVLLLPMFTVSLDQSRMFKGSFRFLVGDIVGRDCDSGFGRRTYSTILS
jgi:hypothetical protein